jgi:hypothetical protein
MFLIFEEVEELTRNCVPTVHFSPTLSPLTMVTVEVEATYVNVPDRCASHCRGMGRSPAACQ